MVCPTLSPCECIATSSHEGLLVDTTGPLANGLTIGPPESKINVLKGDEYVAFVRNGFEIKVEWNSFTDPESPVDYYEIGLFELLDCTNYNTFMHGPTAISSVMAGL